MTARRKPCRLCAAGHVPRDGEHWIVKSIFPARISIKECTTMTMPPDERPSDEDRDMKLTKTQRHYLETMENRDYLQCGWGGMKSTLTIRILEERGLIRAKYYTTGPRWTAQLTNAGRDLIRSTISSGGE